MASGEKTRTETVCESTEASSSSAVEEVDTDAFTKILSEEERKEKLLCFCMLSTPWDGGKWSVINPYNLSAGGNGVSMAKEATALSSYPTGMLDIRHYGCTVWESKIYFVGGYSKHCSRLLSDKVFVFDAASNIWLEPPQEDDIFPRSLQRARAFPRVVAFKNQIYAFGHEPHTGGTAIPPEQWAEVCHIGPGGSRQWRYLPNPPPQDLVDLNSLIDSHVLYPLQNKVLFWVRSVGVAFYDFSNGSWSYVSDPISYVPRWSTSVALIEHFLFWHFFGKIYFYDFLIDKAFQLYSLEREHYFGTPISDDSDSPPSFVVHAGMDKLCLLWFQEDARLLHCKTFKIGFSSGSGPMTLVPDGSTSFSATSFALQSVLPV